MALPHVLALVDRPLPPLSRVLITVALTVATWELRHRTRKSLGSLTPHLLADIGLDPSAAQMESAKRFWHA